MEIVNLWGSIFCCTVWCIRGVGRQPPMIKSHDYHNDQRVTIIMTY